jgi:threonine dehydrogenase-like Zn-dependent dehydrogenase
MRAVWLEDRLVRVVEHLPVPEPGPGEALIRVGLAGICDTDLEMTRGYAPFTGIPGHEFVGKVVSAPGAPEWVGRRVVGEVNVICLSCAECRAGRPTHCERRTVAGISGRPGVFAEYTTLPVRNLHEVPDDVSNEIAVFTEPTAAALEIQEQVRIERGDRVIVVGDGKLGLLIAQTVALRGCDLLVIGRHRRKLDFLDARGIRTAMSDEEPPWKADVVVECSGNREGLAVARSAVRPRGTIVLKSTYAGETRIDLSSVVVDEVTLVGSRCGPFAPALHLLARGALHVRPMIEARMPLDRAPLAFERAALRGSLKVLLEC